MIEAWKPIHLLVALVFTGAVGLLLLSWRDRAAYDIDDRIMALVAMCAGLLFGVAWELVEFVIDWLTGSNLQLSNRDTMTDLLWNDVGAVSAGSLVVWVYCRFLDARARERLGDTAVWLVHGPSCLLDYHGFQITIGVALVAAAAVGALWFAGRPIPGFPIA